MSVSDILNSTRDSNVGLIRNLQASYKKAAAKCAEEKPQRFQSFSELGELSTTYNSIRRDLTMIGAYKVSAPIAESRLEKEFSALESIQEVIKDVRKETADNIHGVQGTNADIANKALTRIQKVLNTLHNGQYLFGGVNTTIKPCGDIVANNNIINDVVTTNYTTAVPNQIHINVSNIHKVPIGIDASNQAFVQTIAAMNKLKVLPQPNLEEVEQTLVKATSLLNELMLRNGEANDIIKEADKYNKSVELEANEKINSTFTIDPAEAASNLRDLQMALLMAFRVEKLNTRLFESLLN